MERHIAFAILFFVIYHYAKTIVTDIVSVGKGLPKCLDWLRRFFRVIASANALSLYQGLMLYLIWQEDSAFTIAIFFGLAALLDRFDGMVAEELGTKSKLGEFLDALMDKVMIIGTAFKCYWTFSFNSWSWCFIIIMLSMDGIRILFTIIQYLPVVFRLAIIQYWPLKIKLGKPLNWQVAANPWGKTKRFFQTAALLIFLLNPGYTSWLYGFFFNGLVNGGTILGLLSNIGHIWSRWWLYQKITKSYQPIFNWFYRPKT
ncbi:CDP-alcohol phosphatidyltransferase family protein [Patescibacteria group bacterium]|nr:CDP-alcohol phosphatidyltransferase family protein [Patescibacteria group bacterium]MBU4511952.1 CDP-alcohol phosphatidyltransferase family protein [Patescibacteria group bacterium]MCG2692699.1 CDP-alcohol phosphatidyltransferase family protein [Candidatus Parcubacteria bacterium]